MNLWQKCICLLEFPSLVISDFHQPTCGYHKKGCRWIYITLIFLYHLNFFFPFIKRVTIKSDVIYRYKLQHSNTKSMVLIYTIYKGFSLYLDWNFVQNSYCLKIEPWEKTLVIKHYETKQGKKYCLGRFILLSAKSQLEKIIITNGKDETKKIKKLNYLS